MKEVMSKEDWEWLRDTAKDHLSLAKAFIGYLRNECIVIEGDEVIQKHSDTSPETFDNWVGVLENMEKEIEKV